MPLIPLLISRIDSNIRSIPRSLIFFSPPESIAFKSLKVGKVSPDADIVEQIESPPIRKLGKFNFYRRGKKKKFHARDFRIDRLLNREIEVTFASFELATDSRPIDNLLRIPFPFIQSFIARYIFLSRDWR